jgi:DHA1 family multidrug resistance protein-like MFS transporter
MAYQAAYTASNQLMPLHLYTLAPDEAQAARNVGIVLTATAVGATLGAVSTGWLSSRVSARFIVMGALGLSGLILSTQYLLTDPLQFAFVRFFLGLCAGGALPACRTALVEQTRIDGKLASQLSTVYGFQQTANHLGMGGGALLATAVATAFGLASVYLSSGFILLAAAILWAFRTQGANWRKGAAGLEPA